MVCKFKNDPSMIVKMINLAKLLVDIRGGKVIVVWNKIIPLLEDLEAMTTAGRSVPMEVVTVGETVWTLNHPALISDLAKCGGVLRKVEEEEDVLILLRRSEFLPWGFRATLIVEGSPGLEVTRAWGRGVRKRQLDDCVEIACLEGTPLVGLQLGATDKKSKGAMQESERSFTLHLYYTNREGCIATILKRFPSESPDQTPSDCVSAVLDLMEVLHPPSES